MQKGKTEIDYVVKQHVRNGMVVLAKYTDRTKMLSENPTVDKEKFIVIGDETTFCRYNEVDGKEMLWEGMPKIEPLVAVPTLEEFDSNVKKDY